MMDLENFDWGCMDEPYLTKDGDFIYYTHIDGSQELWNTYQKRCMIEEIFVNKLYEKIFKVEENDIVVDVGSSIGPFTYSILDSKPKHVYCLEPSVKEFKTLNKNLRGYQVTTINKGISSVNSVMDSQVLFGGETEMETLKFSTFIDNYSIDEIDFLKTDCEGGEYDIFIEENSDFIFNKVRKIVGEWHLGNPDLKEKFRKFRDFYLNRFENFYVYSVDGHDIKWDLWNDHFIEYYTEVIINIDNR